MASLQKPPRKKPRQRRGPGGEAKSLAIVDALDYERGRVPRAATPVVPIADLGEPGSSASNAPALALAALAPGQDLDLVSQAARAVHRDLEENLEVTFRVSLLIAVPRVPPPSPCSRPGRPPGTGVLDRRPIP
jgi:hypothetical protein